MSLQGVCFYSKRADLNAIRKRRKIEKTEKLFLENPLPKQYIPKLTDPCIFRKTFYRQNDAFQFTRSVKSEDLHVFAFESEEYNNSGGRLYLVCSYQQFYHYYSQLQLDKRHHYEVIPECAVCKLYFDLEYKKAYNERNGALLVKTLIQIVLYYLKKDFGADVSETDVLELDATTPSKFSRHLIFQSSNSLFKDNIQAGNFVKRVCNEILKESRKTDGKINSFSAEVLKDFIVIDKDGKESFLCDTAVYTKNRNFRLYKSCKLKQQNPLLIASENEYICSSDEQYFLDSLISNIRFADNMRILTCEGDSCYRNSSAATEQIQSHKQGVSVSIVESLHGYQHSPYPEIDSYISSVLYKDGIRGKIRRWFYFAQGEQLVYDIANYRWCGRIERHHKNNNIIFVADLRGGFYYQKCHDPDCRSVNYRSADYKLPENTLPKYFVGNDDEENGEEEVNDEELLNAALQLENDENNSLSDEELLNATISAETAAAEKQKQ